ncbi:MAG: AAA family ATPase [Methylococcaceae bacterium]
MVDNPIFSTTLNQSPSDDEGLDTLLPLITKERTQKFDLLLHLIPNLKQHLIVCGASGIGKTLLLDMLYDIDNDAWQCCFVQGSAELSFETIEIQLTKTMLRNNHESLNQAFHDFQEQHKKIVLIIDDAGLCVSGLMTTLIDYAATQPALKLIFSLTPETRNNHRKTDKALENCYLLEIPTLSKRQCAYFLRHLAAKPRTYSALPIDEKLLDKIYRDTHGIPARIMADFTKLSRENQNDYSKWLMAFAGLMILTIAINQGIRYFKKEAVEDTAILPVEKVESIEQPVAPKPDKKLPTPVESQTKSEEQDIIIPEFQLDIEKGIVAAPTPVTTVPVEKKPEPTTENVDSEQVKSEKSEQVESEKPAETVQPEPAAEPEIKQPEPEKAAPVVETTTEPVKPEVITPTTIVEPVISFPKVEPAKGVKIQALPEKQTIIATPIAAPEVKPVKEVKIEPVKKIDTVKKIEIKPIEKPVEIKKPEPPKVEPVKKIEPKSTKEQANVEKIVSVAPPVAGRYTLQLITLSSEVAIENFKKKHPELNKNFRVVKSISNEKERFGLMYGGFSNATEATNARQTLPAEFANAFPRKLNP